MTRSIQSPGIEIHEIDKSQYNREDFSLVGTTALVCGFADKGPDYTINWINSVQYLQEVYGVPTTEEERYFYNACYEILQKGGVLLGAKLPYINSAKDRYASVEYSFEETSGTSENGFARTIKIKKLSDSDILRTIQAEVDTTLSTYIEINSAPKVQYITTEELDKNLVGTFETNNKIRIVDITHSPYEAASLVKRDENDNYISIEPKPECVGILPVITTALNAIYFQHLLSSSYQTTVQYENTFDTDANNDNPNRYVEITENLEFFNPVKDFGQVKATPFTVKTTAFTESSEITPNAYMDENFSTKICDSSINTYTVAYQAMEQFPTLTFLHEKQLDRTYLKQIGVVVFKISLDNLANNKLNFTPVESFYGSLDRFAQDPLSKASIFIDNVVNSQSKYIRLFSSVRDKNCLETADSIFIHNQIAASLGLSSAMLKKQINLRESIYDSLNTIFANAQDKHKYIIDIVVDAGLSNIAQKASKSYFSTEEYANGYDSETEESFINQQFDITSTQSVYAWKAVIDKFTNFCGKTRKDCIFLADSPKAFALENDQKIIRRSKPQNTIMEKIIPKLRYISGVDSSYAAGYCDWFLGYDAYSGNSMWIPPSIKAAGIYIYTDIYYNQWDAPAGMTRGVVRNVVDCAFSPQQQESDRIYIQGWNYAVNYPLNGIVLEGQRTFQKKATAFDRVNVRRLFLYLERQVSNIAKYFVYEGNTAYQRARFVDMIKPYFDQAVQRGGILEYYIQCDENNNTPQVIDNNEMRCTIAVKPVKTIEFIVLNFICTNQSANVVEVITSA